MTTEAQQQPQPEAVAAPDVGIKVSSMREAVLAAAAAAPAVAAAAASGGGKGKGGAAKNMAGVYARQMMKSSWIAQTDGQLLTDILPVLVRYDGVTGMPWIDRRRLTRPPIPKNRRAAASTCQDGSASQGTLRCSWR